VLKDVTFEVPRGKTYAFLGRNGAGKTTTILTLLGLLRPDAGEIEVLGLSPARDALEIRRRVGYMAEDQVMFGWMRIRQLLGFCAPFYPTWDAQLAGELLRRFDLSPKARVRHLSKGEGRRLALLLALAHRPELVILDDPTLGLDPIMRREFLRDVVEHLQGRGVTVFFSSHLLYETEPVADIVAILDKGGIVRESPTEELREDVKRLVLPAESYERLRSLPGALDVRRSDRRVAVVVEGAATALEEARGAGVRPEVVDLNLDEIFEAYVAGRPDEQRSPEPRVERVA
jgi:ABC-2 type transport system ATP-binding protein